MAMTMGFKLLCYRRHVIHAVWLNRSPSTLFRTINHHIVRMLHREKSRLVHGTSETHCFFAAQAIVRK